MGKGFTLVVRLGMDGPRYPHILVDAHGWLLRLGPHWDRDDKYYSSLPSVFEGMVEHALRRRLGGTPAEGLEALARDVRAEMKELRDLAIRCLENLGDGGRYWPVHATHAQGTACGPSRGGSGPGTAHIARKRAGGGNG